jgi:hypothetical protein
MKVGEGWRALLLGAAVLLPGLAAADNIAGSASQVGAWRVSAYTRGNTAIFDHCTLYRVQSDGFGLAVGYTPQGVWTMGAEAPGWGLVANESYYRHGPGRYIDLHLCGSGAQRARHGLQRRP